MCYWLALSAWQFAGKLTGQNPNRKWILLYYHSIPDAMRSRFARQMELVGKISTPVLPDELNALPNDGRKVTITFDDGFQSVMKNALPELRARNITCIVFVPTGYLGRPPAWEMTNEAPERRETIMTGQQLKAVSSQGLIIGSHTVTHAKLTSLTEKKIREELEASKEQLEKILGHQIDYLSFPHGLYDARVVELAKKAGYKKVFTIDPVTVGNSSEKFVIGRFKADPEDWPLEFRLKVVGAYAWLPRAFALKRKIRNRILK